MKLFLLLALTTTILAEVIGLVEVSRHGARAPEVLYPFVEKYFNSPGQLTAAGMRQHFLIGYQLKQNYIDGDSPLINNMYNSSNIYVQSTQVNRTIESAQSQLVGLYPTGHMLLDEGQIGRAKPPIKIDNSFNVT